MLETTVAPNRRIRNSAVTELRTLHRRLVLQAFNTLAYLGASKGAGQAARA